MSRFIFYPSLRIYSFSDCTSSSCSAFSSYISSSCSCCTWLSISPKRYITCMNDWCDLSFNENIYPYSSSFINLQFSHIFECISVLPVFYSPEDNSYLFIRDTLEFSYSCVDILYFCFGDFYYLSSILYLHRLLFSAILNLFAFIINFV